MECLFPVQLIVLVAGQHHLCIYAPIGATGCHVTVQSNLRTLVLFLLTHTCRYASVPRSIGLTECDGAANQRKTRDTVEVYHSTDIGIGCGIRKEVWTEGERQAASNDCREKNQTTKLKYKPVP